MISLVLNIFLWFVTALLALLPDSSGLPESITDAVNRSVALLYNFDFIVPVSLLLELVVSALYFQLAIQAFRFTMWIINYFRGR